RGDPEIRSDSWSRDREGAGYYGRKRALDPAPSRSLLYILPFVPAKICVFHGRNSRTPSACPPVCCFQTREQGTGGQAGQGASATHSSHSTFCMRRTACGGIPC